MKEVFTASLSFCGNTAIEPSYNIDKNVLDYVNRLVTDTSYTYVLKSDQGFYEESGTQNILEGEAPSERERRNLAVSTTSSTITTEQT